MTATLTTSSDFLGRLDAIVDDLRETAGHRDRHRQYAREEIDRLREIGFWRLTVPVEHGGHGLDATTLVEAVLRLAAADASLGQIPQNHFMTVERLRLSAPRAQREHWLDVLGRGALFGNAAAEPGERPPGASATSVTPAAAGWSLTGSKVYSTGALLADYVAVQARDLDDVVITVLVPASADGVTIDDDWDALGQRTTASGRSYYRQVPIAEHDVIVHTADPVATYRISALGQLLHAAIDAGIASGALDESIDLARRVHAGRGSGAATFTEDTLGLDLVGELHLATLTARRLVESAAAQVSALDDTSTLSETAAAFHEVVAAKVASTRAALRVTNGLFEVGGSSSTRPDLGLDRYWRDARTHTLHDAVCWKPYTLGRWVVTGDLADPWSIAHPFAPTPTAHETSPLP
ncbi:acyl-CoA dehydrogenase family protein [Aeromicrobium piscarium]|uniref:Dibenzothiophene monooxygenase n=1 Tax=Aeromicrobium piscarium TaxID=2590901 RepID=A0A554S750_9ACTN|nr:acyl-CoA dehydrogenase family protein [Aeromicrobium piscarium]TSD62180.1 acyl-CoA dehydrogenase [Aeromicrobium piscarium]